MNPMREIKVAKVTLNMGVGADAAKLDGSMRLLERITGHKPIKTSSMKRIPSWGVRPKLPIACMVVVRGEDAITLLKRLFESVDFKIPIKKFDKTGNFSFGIAEYINILGVEYDVELGIVGMNIAVTLERPGYRVSKKLIRSAKIGIKHRISQQEAIDFIKQKFNVEVLEE